MKTLPAEPEIIEHEVDLVLEAAMRRYGIDFRGYCRASLERRLANLAGALGLAHISGLIPPLLHQPEFLDRFINGISVCVTEPFRDADVFDALRQLIFPKLRTYAFAKIWHAGCASGEEVYSLAVLLREAGLLDRVRLYATDINTQALATAHEGIYPLKTLEAAEAGYRAAGGSGRLADHYVSQYDKGRFDSELRKAVVFSQHNLVTDAPFGEMELIICRNVLIYFNRSLQDQTLALFRRSLSHRGHLLLGSKENLTLLPTGVQFETVDSHARLYRAL